jgi:hypothetical protein
MSRTSSSIDKIRAELAWVTETPDPNKCGCRNLPCCEETGQHFKTVLVAYISLASQCESVQLR